MSANFLTQLPLDILIDILARLDRPDLRNLMLTCKGLRNLMINEGTIWRSSGSTKLILRTRKSEIISWYNKCRISYNWCKGIYKNKVILQHHTNYMPWLQFGSSRSWYLSVGSELRCYATNKQGLPLSNILWSLQVPTIKRADVRTNDISRFIVKDNVIVCGNRDGCVAVYALDNKRQKPNLLTHIEDSHENGQVEVSAVEKVRDIIVTVSNDSPYICLWECKKDEKNSVCVPIRREYGLKNEIGCRCVAANESQDKLALGLNGNSKPLLLDVNTGNFLMSSNSTRDINQVIRDIQWHDANCVAYVTHSGKLQFIDIRSSRVVYNTRDPFQSSLYCLKTDSERGVLVGSSQYSRCVLYDLRSAHHVQIFFALKKASPVYSLDFDLNNLIAAADRGVADLNFNVMATTPARDYSYTFEFVKDQSNE